MEIDRLYELFLQSKGISTDTRNVQPQQLFFALRGTLFDGNRYAAAALEKGALAVVVDDAAVAVSEHYIVVNDTLAALQNLANYHRRRFSIPVLAISGSNGKTTTKELLNAVLRTRYRTHATVGNLNNHIGVPLTLLAMPTDCEIAIIEMGANHGGEIAQLCQIAEPTHGLLTGIGKAHLEGFGGIEGVQRGKGELFEAVKNKQGVLFVNKNDRRVYELAQHYAPCLLYGSSHHCHIQGEVVSDSPNNAAAFLRVKWKNSAVSHSEHLIETQLIGDYNLNNVLAAVAVGVHFGADTAHINEAIAQYQPQNQRSQWLAFNDNRYQMVVDAYNANPTSMKAALDNFALLPHPHKAVLLGEMLELGDYSTEEHQKIVEQLQTIPLEYVALVGGGFKKLPPVAGFHIFENSDEAAKDLLKKNFTEILILLKGSRGSKMEKVLQAVQAHFQA